MNQPEQPDMLEPKINDRGLAYMPTITGTLSGTGVNVHESSNAERDCLWVEARGYHTNDGDGGATQITIDNALILAAQIYALAERRGYSTPASRAATMHPAGALTFGPDAAPKAGDLIRYSYNDETYTGRIRAVHEDGTIETDEVDLPLGHEFTPITGMYGTEHDECGHRADGTQLTHCGYRRADHEPTADEDTEPEQCPVPAALAAALGDADDDPRYARSYTPRGYPYENVHSMPGSSNGPTPDGTGPRPLAVVLDEDITGIDNSLTRTRHNVAALADRLEDLERCYREVPRPQDVGMLAAHLAKIERLEGDLAARDRELKAHKDVLAQVGDEKRRLTEQLEAHHRHDARTPSHRQVVLIEGLLTAVERGVDPAEHPLDVPPGVAGRVADALVKARTDGIVAFVSRQSVEYRKHSAAAVDEDRALAVRMGVAPSRFLDDGELSESESDAAAVIIKAGGEFATSVEGAVAAAEREANTDE